MKKLEIVGFKRANLGKKESKDLRAEGLIPSVLYGGGEQIHFSAPTILFRDLLYTPDAYEVTLNIEGEIRKAILQDTQFHPVNDSLLHADFLEITDKPIKVNVPVKFVGNSPGVIKGGKLVQKLRKITLRGQAENIPDFVEVSIEGLDLGKSVRVAEVNVENVEILNARSLPIATIDIPRSLRGK
ncbi:50S ribosomal protein L25/general stress protein Ctc [Siphonobacter curvatus]|uniref:Large ribosomal subunit protein bL25 n=1 Tax=Siphonobacter curvatus TaxID=2094562 RepID=A0A2S7IQA4_9BACT|nr:50S ribosomal protein L25/general stress protein Ctc [Siphonobacter curvatus]PQA59903.1 50S ribosomal protein L25 [Siphonobacter curvatus]